MSKRARLLLLPPLVTLSLGEIPLDAVDSNPISREIRTAPPENIPDLHNDSAITCMTSTQDPANQLITKIMHKDYAQLIVDIQNGSTYLNYSSQLSSKTQELITDGQLALLNSKQTILPLSTIKTLSYCYTLTIME